MEEVKKKKKKKKTQQRKKDRGKKWDRETKKVSVGIQLSGAIDNR